MDVFSPEFSKFWFPGREAEGSLREDCDEEARRQQKALEELAERVNAARTIV